MPVLALLVLALVLAATALAEPVRNGFDLAGASVPVDEILHGGPPRDGIPSIDAPRFETAAEAAWLADTARVIGVRRNGIAKAYPIAILNWHEIVNDRFGAEALVVTYCPLCGTGMVFEAGTATEARQFGVSGLLYNSDVLLYDRATSSLWSQIAGRAISGPLRGTPLTLVTASHTSWADWRARHPQTLVLSRQTGFDRDYRRDPYRGYAESRSLYFPVSAARAGYHPKEQVLALSIDGQHKAYPFAELAKAQRPVRDQVGGIAVSVTFDPEHVTAAVTDADGNELPSTIAYWFAWSAFYPDGEVYTHAQGR